MSLYLSLSLFLYIYMYIYASVAILAQVRISHLLISYRPAIFSIFDRPRVALSSSLCHYTMAFSWSNAEKQQQFDQLYSAATDAKETGQLVGVVYEMLDILKDSGYAYIEDMHPLHMGIHPANRSGKKMVAVTFQKKGFKIKKSGFTFKLCGPDKAVAFEDDPVTHNCELHTVWVAGSEEFGNYKPGTVRAGSVGCSHLNQWLAAVVSGAKSKYPELCDQNSDRFSTRLLGAANKQLAAALANGLKWTVIKSCIERMYPQLPSILQRALNVEHHIGEGDRYRICYIYIERERERLPWMYIYTATQDITRAIICIYGCMHHRYLGICVYMYHNTFVASTSNLQHVS